MSRDHVITTGTEHHLVTWTHHFPALHDVSLWVVLSGTERWAIPG